MSMKAVLEAIEGRMTCEEIAAKLKTCKWSVNSKLLRLMVWKEIDREWLDGRFVYFKVKR